MLELVQDISVYLSQSTLDLCSAACGIEIHSLLISKGTQSGNLLSCSCSFTGFTGTPLILTLFDGSSSWIKIFYETRTNVIYSRHIEKSNRAQLDQCTSHSSGETSDELGDDFSNFFLVDHFVTKYVMITTSTINTRTAVVTPVMLYSLLIPGASK